MSEQYTNQVLKVVVAQICQTIGYHSIQTTPLELMTDILHKYLEQISKQTYRYSELYNRTEANLDDVGLAYRDMNINLPDIAEYIQYVDPVPCVLDVPRYPMPKEPHLNFLKPGSREVLTRPVHIHEHLPPVNPPSEDEEETNVEKTEGENGENGLDVVNVSNDETATPFFKRPSSIPSSSDKSEPRKLKMYEEETKPIREISSVMMTTSGFISPAREGKLPEVKEPVIIPEAKPRPPTPPISVVPVALPVNNIDGKFSDKKLKKLKNLEREKEKEKRKDKLTKEEIRAEKLRRKLERQRQEASQSIHGGITLKKEKLEPSFLSPGHHPHPDINSSPMSISGGLFEHSIKKEHVVLTERHEKLEVIGLPNQPIPGKRKIGRPRKDKSGEPSPTYASSKKYMKMSEKIAKANQAEFYSSILGQPARDSFNPVPLGRGRPPLHKNNPNHPLHPNYVPPQFNPRFPVFATPPQHHPRMTEEKISSEPDKSKLNIFKKIPKIKEESSKADIKPLHPIADQVIVIDDDQNSNPPTPLTPNLPSFKREQPEFLDSPPYHPLNMSLGSKAKSPKNADFNFGRAPNTSTPKSIPQFDANGQKIRKKYKTKDKLNKQMLNPFNPVTAEDILKNADFMSTLNSLQNKSHQQQGPAAGPSLHNQQNMMFPMFPLSASPGLIPNQGLYPPFMPTRPFGMPPGVPIRPAIPDMNLLFPRFRGNTANDEKDEQTKVTTPVESKPLCNVAPLVPESLKLEVPSPSHLNVQSTPSPNKPQHIQHYQPKEEDLFSPKKSMLFKQEAPIEIEESPPRYPSPPALPTTPQFYTPDQPPVTPGQDVTVVDISKDYSDHDDDEPDEKPPPTPNILQPGNSPTKEKEKEARKEKEKHKKDKREKDKEAKIKKKKDKKDKIKNREKEKGERKKEKDEKKEGKEKLKKEKKEKRKEKERAAMSHGMDSISSSDHFESMSSVPKLTLKLGQSPRPDTPDSSRKLSIFTKIGHPPNDDSTDDLLDSPTPLKNDREPSPELARISPLVTRPPKPQKPTSSSSTSLKQKDIPEKSSPDSTLSPTTSTPNITPPKPGRGRPPGSVKNSTSKGSIMTGKSPKHNKQEGVGSVGGTAIGAVDGETAAPPTGVRDSEGNQVWICPACGRVDDGTPMIGCDGCDAWYHWVCVGIQVPPDQNEDWYCRVCIARKQESHGTTGEKKKKRKKNKEKKEH